jgi:hypothetical protein
MKLFLSWSGDTSRKLAESLKEWLPLVVPSVQPWFSAVDIPVGKTWNHDLRDQLAASRLAILCVTRDNVEAPWLMFEAGAVAKAVEQSHVCPYLLGMEPSDLPRGPLIQFQAVVASADGTRRLVSTLNDALGDDREPDQRVLLRFESFWPRLEDSLSRLRKLRDESSVSTSPIEAKVNEILDIVRAGTRAPRAQLPQLGELDSLRLGLSASLDLPKDEEIYAVLHGGVSDRSLSLMIKRELVSDVRLRDSSIRIRDVLPRRDGLAVTFERLGVLGAATLRGTDPNHVPGNQFAAKIIEPIVARILANAKDDSVAYENQGGASP